MWYGLLFLSERNMGIYKNVCVEGSMEGGLVWYGKIFVGGRMLLREE